MSEQVVCLYKDMAEVVTRLEGHRIDLCPDSLHEDVTGTTNDRLRREYDLSGGERGRYAKRYAEGTNVVVLDPDVAQPDRG